MENLNTGQRFEQFVATIARLRAPGGCPWDREQTHASIARNMLEEAHEAVDAIERNDIANLREELGDVLLQVVFQSQMASEAGEFTLDDVLGDITDKMVRRHPHVFGDEAAFAAAHLSEEQIAMIRAAQTPDTVLDLWDQIKLVEKRNRRAGRNTAAGAAAGAGGAAGAAAAPNTAVTAGGAEPAPPGLLDGIPVSLPALMQATDISRKAVAAGFEWPDLASVWQQVESELAEYREATLASPPGQASPAASEEFGDILFSLVNVARKQGIDAESALRATCRKFRSRWSIMEQYANAAGQPLSEHSTEELERLWQLAKQEIEGSAHEQHR
ncbi:MAG: nucleoside triphosphate pyrophosphohydrolase [Coriobacteriales bacterium]|jgi:tetrapyrrole methylase family protein/MazG family protein|nr:nucleoside triphosphate pyrophosphohydrolase [Coriobacteriales bacterium]